MRPIDGQFACGIAAVVVWLAAVAAAADPPGTKSADRADRTKAAMLAGQEWLAEHQNEDGSWRFDQPADSRNAYANPGTCRSRTGATGLALAAFPAAGQSHKRSDARAPWGIDNDCPKA